MGVFESKCFAVIQSAIIPFPPHIQCTISIQLRIFVRIVTVLNYLVIYCSFAPTVRTRRMQQNHSGIMRGGINLICGDFWSKIVKVGWGVDP